MVKLWAIAKNTFLQTLRQPVFTILLILMYALLIVGFLLSTWTMSPTGDHQASDQKMMVNLGLSTLLTTGLLVAVFSASSVLSREIDDRTALTVVSKPVPRASFVLGKYLGAAGAVTVALFLGGLALTMLYRHRVLTNASDPVDWPVVILGLSALLGAGLLSLAGNYIFGWSFLMSFVLSQLTLMSLAMGIICFVGKGWQVVPFGQGIHPDLIDAIYAIALISCLLTAVAIAASTRLGQLSTLWVCIGVTVLGGYHELVFSSVADGNVVATVGSYLLPNTQYFLLMEAFMRDVAIEWGYLLKLTAYAALLIAAVLAIGIGLFQTRQLEASPSASGPGGVNLLAATGRIVGAVVFLAGILAAGGAMRSVEAWLAAGQLIIIGAVAWHVSGAFGRGRRWSYWLVLIPGGSMVAAVIAAWPWPAWREILTDRLLPGQLAAATVLGVAALVVCILPASRHHFALSKT
jgi:ABC-2 type transport system permease protein